MKTVYVIVILLLSFRAYAQKAEVFQKDGFAIRGYDPVSFFKEDGPMKGDEKFSYEWREARWLFSSGANLELFRSDPEKYAPQYGGYCAYGMADGHKAPTEPDTWTVIEGRLYFNYNRKVKELWVKDTKGFIEKADINWPRLKNRE
jgi:YHS domain-containing protein